MEIENYNDLVQSANDNQRNARKIVLDLYKSAIEVVDPYQVIYNNISYDSVKQDIIIGKTRNHIGQNKVIVIGAGKAVGRMAEALERILPIKKLEGIICVPEGVKKNLILQRIECFESTHPIPSVTNIHNTEKILRLLEDVKSNDFIITLVSGGGSAIWAAPIPPIVIDDLILLNKELINSGMTIHEINIIRKHVSTIKGGKLTEKIRAENIIQLVISDVIGDNLSNIASGPLHPDPSTFSDAKFLLNKHNLWDTTIPTSIKTVINRGINGDIPETPKNYNHLFKRVKTHIIGSNKLACNDILSNADKSGLQSLLLTDKLEGDARWLGCILARVYFGLAESTKQPLLVVSGGEPTVKVQGLGKGGRNQEIVAAVLKEFVSHSSSPDITFLSAGTDGIDGNSPYAGALIDDISIIKQKNLNLIKYQNDNNLTIFFEKLGGSLLITGPTGTNVMDIQIALLNSSKV